jgi:fatty-acyl-CoA synthase
LRGVPDQQLGETLLAWIKLKAGAELSEDDVREFCRGKIA